MVGHLRDLDKPSVTSSILHAQRIFTPSIGLALIFSYSVSMMD